MKVDTMLNMESKLNNIEIRLISEQVDFYTGSMNIEYLMKFLNVRFVFFRGCRKDIKELKLCLIDFSISNEMMVENKHVTIAQSW